MFTFGKTHITFICIAVFVCGFLIGQKITKNFYLLEIEKIENSALKIENENLSKKISIETDLKDKVNEVMSYEENTKADIERNYNSSMLILSDDQNHSSKMQLSDITTATTTISANGKDRCDNTYNRNFKRLSERLLKQAKEYDLLKAKYNALVEIWKQTEQKLK